MTLKGTDHVFWYRWSWQGMGLYFGDFSMSSIGTSFICIGGFIGWMVLTGKHERDPRKKKK